MATAKDSNTHRTCRKCGETKPLDGFHKADVPTGRRRDCKKCKNEAKAVWRRGNQARATEMVRRWRNKNHKRNHENFSRWRLENKDRVSEYDLRKRLGVALGTRAKMLAEQDGKCAICKREGPIIDGKPIGLDHSHTTGQIRGLICIRCNFALGHMQDDPDRLRAAAAYVEMHAQKAKCLEQQE